MKNITKQNSLVRHAMGYKNYLRPRYIYLLSIIYCIVLFLVFKVQLSGDSQSYISAWEVIRNGNIDIWRTPVYPLFLGLLNNIFGSEYFLLIAVIIQHVFFLISVRYFYILMKSVVNNDLISFFVTVFYAFYPCVQTYNCFIQTETFAAVATIFLLYSTLMFYKKEETIYGVGTFCWLLFLVFLRPSSIYLIPVLFLFWLWVYVKNRKRKHFLWMGLGGCLVVGILLSIYIVNFKKNYHLLTPSGIGVINSYCIGRQACILEPMVSPDIYRENNFKGCVFDHEVATNMPDVFYESECAINEFGLKKFSDYVNTSIRRNYFSYVKRIVINVQRSSTDRLLGTAFPYSTRLDIVTVNLNFFFFLILIYLIVLIGRFRRRKNVEFSFLIYIIGLSHMFVIFVGSPDDYARLSIPVFPIFLLMLGQLSSLIRVNVKPNIDFI